MKIIAPRAFDPAKITTNVPITETLWTAGQYLKGYRAYVEPSFDLYEVVADPHTNDEPTAGAAKDVKTWAKVGKVNAYACFDNVLQNPTVTAGDFDMTIAPSGEIGNGLALFGVFGGSVRVTVTDPTDGQVYDRVVSLTDNSNLLDWPDYFFATIILKPDFVLLDLPFYSTASVRIRISGAARIGEVVLGQVTDLGRVLFGASPGIIDRSTKVFDVFGGAQIVERGYSKRANFVVNIPTQVVDFVIYALAQRRAKPTVYVGSVDFASTLIYGFYRDITPTIAGPNASQYVIELEGLV